MYLLLLFVSAIVLFLCYYILSFFTGAPFVPTPMSVISEMLTSAKISKKDVVYDLGSGDGRMLIEAAKRGAHARGWEINPFLVIWTKLVAMRYGVGKNVNVHLQTYQKADLHDATVIFLYNMPAFLPALEKKFKKDLKPGTKIYSYKFSLDSFKPVSETESGVFCYVST
jgi:SAM-dependent methyltransferase